MDEDQPHLRDAEDALRRLEQERARLEAAIRDARELVANLDRLLPEADERRRGARNPDAQPEIPS